jgi:hypothetical protein
MRAAIVSLLALVASAAATSGVDVSTRVTKSDWACLKGKGFSFGIIRAWQSNGVPDANAVDTIVDAWEGGMSSVGIYVFPCYSCGNGAGQIAATIKHLKEHNITYKCVAAVCSRVSARCRSLPGFLAAWLSGCLVVWLCCGRNPYTPHSFDRLWLDIEGA